MDWKVPPLLVPCAGEGAGCAQYLNAGCRYFEVTILPPNTSSRTRVPISASFGGSSVSPSLDYYDPCWCVAVGLSTEEFTLAGYQPGWDKRSCAYHGDDGRVFFGNTRLMTLPTFGSRDTVGCGLRSDCKIFFTLNGRLVGLSPELPHLFMEYTNPRQVLFPTIGIDSHCPVKINWGRTPFLYDLAGLWPAQLEAHDNGFWPGGVPPNTRVDCACTVS
jgi:hypothetical protein